MENRVVFRNPGEFDTDFLKLFGVSAKEHDNPIGRFGTGLKYAIAILLREKQQVELYIGSDTYVFYTVEEEKRGKGFNFVYMAHWNGNIQRGVERLPFTTALGQNWELWMAFRELYSNCVDEKGEVYVTDEEIECAVTGETIFEVIGEKFVQIANDKADVFLPSEPINKTSYVDIHEGETKAVFNKGIKVGEFEKPFMHRYDITGYAHLSEDRKLQSETWFESQFAESVSTSVDEDLIEKIITAPREYQESTINFDRDTTPSDTFLKVVKKLIKKNKDSVNSTVVRLYENFVKKVRASRKERREIWRLDITLPANVSRDDIKADLMKVLREYEVDASIEWPDNDEVIPF